MENQSISKVRELSLDEVENISGGGAEDDIPTRQGGGLPKPVFGKPGTTGPLPILTDLP